MCMHENILDAIHIVLWLFNVLAVGVIKTFSLDFRIHFTHFALFDLLSQLRTSRMQNMLFKSI